MSIKLPGIDDQPVAFGKHKGSTPRQILKDDDYGYVIWLYETMKRCSRDLYLDAELQKQEADAESDQDNGRGDRWGP